MVGRFETRDVALAAFLVSLGIGAWLHWSITDPSFDQTEAQSEWDHVLAFSALVLGLTVGAAALGRTLSQTVAVRRLALTLLATGVLAAVTNVVEDGFSVEAAFLAFVLLTGIQLVALVALAVALGISVRGPRRLLALAPLASAMGVIVYVHAGGPILLLTWCSAAVCLLVTRRDEAAACRSCQPGAS
jgi:hypothetical protein